MDTALRSAENLKELFDEEGYKYFVAKLAIHHMNVVTANKTDLYKRVNKLLDQLGLGSVSYGFIYKIETANY